MCRRRAAFALVLGLTFGFAPQSAVASPDPSEVRASRALGRLVEAYWQDHLRLRPLHATLIGDHRFDGELPDSLASAELGREYALEKRALEALAAIDLSSLSARDRLTYDVFRWDRELEVEGFRYPSELLPIMPSGGVPALMAQFGSGAGAQPFGTVRDYDNWLRRLQAYVVWLDRAVVNLRRGLARGYVLPQIVVQQILPPLQTIAETPVARSLFLRPVLAFPAGIPAVEQTRLRRAYHRTVAERVIPAYRRLYDFLRRDYLPRARTTLAWSDLPQGREWYAYRVRRATATALTPEELHRLGLEEVRRTAAEADQTATELGLHGTRQACLEALRADPHAFFERDEDVVAAVAALKARVRQRLAEFIDPVPSGDFEVRALAAGRASAVSLFSFRAGSADGSRAGVLYVNAAELRAHPKYELESEYLGAVEPGRMLELSASQGAAPLPSFRRFGGYLAFAEGWGFYVEGLGRDLGLYADGPSLYAALTLQLSRAARVVIDTGVHSQGWSRERAIAYLVANTALSAAAAAADVDRVIANPAQGLLAYEVGAMRLRAGQTLGARFNARTFHRQLLAAGPLPIEVAEREFGRWLVTQGAAP